MWRNCPRADDAAADAEAPRHDVQGACLVIALGYLLCSGADLIAARRRLGNQNAFVGGLGGGGTASGRRADAERSGGDQGFAGNRCGDAGDGVLASFVGCRIRPAQRIRPPKGERLARTMRYRSDSVPDPLSYYCQVAHIYGVTRLLRQELPIDGSEVYDNMPLIISGNDAKEGITQRICTALVPWFG